MQGDAESKLEPPPQQDIWELPRIRAVRVNRVRYRTPRNHISAGEVVARSEGVEILVETDGEIPMRALSPALHVGGVEVTENERTSETSYRFFVAREEAMRTDDPIVLGWVGHPVPQAEAEFRYAPPTGVIEEPPPGD